LLSIINGSENTHSKREIQSMLPKLKERREELKEVDAKTLQMVVFMLNNNLKVLAELKKRGKKVGKLRYKKYGKLKSFILNQSDFNIIEIVSKLNKLCISKVGEVPMRIHRPVEGKNKASDHKALRKWGVVRSLMRQSGSGGSSKEKS